MLDNCSVLLYYLIVRVVLNDSVCCDAWLSLVERYVRDVEVAGSNPVASIYEKCRKSNANTRRTKGYGIFCFHFYK